MTGPLADFGRDWHEFADGLADWQVSILRRTAAEMADGLDLAAMLAVEGATDWRDLQNTCDRYADR
ncbi:MAG: hypothetical protein J0H34_20825 [Rhizobiales bacterium]|nr:hypothetical protein [Hyphomicrobiales bacterium]